MNVPFWTKFLEKFSQEKNQVFLSVLKQAHVINLTENILTLSSPNPGVKTYLEGKKRELEELIERYGGKKLQVDIILELKTTKKELPVLSYEPSKEDIFIHAGLNLKYQFDNFAVSSTNQVAFAAAQAVASSPGHSYNPLFFYGGVGVGKTHLAQSIVRQILEQNPDKKAYFCPGDHFTNELIESIKEKTTARFRRKYRLLNIIVIDDVQFIAGKQHVQEEIFHTFNSIVSSGGQVILISDRPPGEIKALEDRLRSRFSGGLTVDIQAPDFELRTAILLIKAREKSIDLDIEVAKVIAEQVDDTRALEGTLLSIYAQIIGKKERIDLEAVDRYFNQKTARVIKRVSPTDVIKTVCTFYNIKQSHIKSPNRSENIALTRQIIMNLMRHELNLNLKDIANLLNRKDHTTVMHGAEKVSGLMMKDQNFKEQIDRIVQTLHSST